MSAFETTGKMQTGDDQRVRADRKGGQCQRQQRSHGPAKPSRARPAVRSAIHARFHASWERLNSTP